ncbi:GHKL domain-containing protein [Streptococcus sp. NLN64]|uniref:sensor histidine kinase n=1 Tax=Streptococcus sp. NLN64 TaxID=2822799 RepID=UPI0018CB6C50|nr:GHKL domain-containing protein [Streptococcus sp. NLN64]MBG9367018.1 GHKL domain-containing protein [Streptococcus sp. NLN64]
MVLISLFHIYTAIANIFMMGYFFYQESYSKFPNRRQILFLVGLVGVEAYVYYQDLSLAAIVSILCGGVANLYLARIYGHSWKQGVFWTFFFLAQSLLLESCLALVLMNFIANLYTIESLFIYINLLILLGALLTFFLKQFLRPTEGGASILRLTIVPIITAVLLFLELTQQQNRLILTFGLLIINGLVLFFYDWMQKEEVERIRIQSEMERWEGLLESAKATRALKHDLKNHHVTLLALLQEEKYDQVKQVLGQNLASLESSETFYTNDGTLNYLLNQKQSEAKKVGVEVRIHCLLPENIALNPNIIAILLGNLLDNSIAAVARLETAASPIELQIYYFKNKLTIAIQNPFDIKEKSSRVHRQKSGLGTKNIRKLVSNNGGLYHQETDGPFYKVEIIFPRVDLVTSVIN